MRILITGVTGFLGGHLVEHLRTEGGHTLAGVSRQAAWSPEWSHLAGTAKLHAAELSDTARLETLLDDLQPEWIVHLAGYANTGRSFHEPARCWADNLGGTQSLYTAIAHSGVRPRILFVSTGLIYGDAEGPDVLCDERSVLKPGSPYAASKAAADLLSYQATRSPGLDIVRVRLFNQIGPRQSPDYAVANFARQLAAIESGRQAFIETGDLSAERDLTDARDVVRAFRLLLEKGVAGEVYNAGRGHTRTMQSVLDALIGLTKTRVEVRQKLDPNRKADAAVSRVDPRKLIAATKWQPRYELEQTLRDTLDYWRGVESAKSGRKTG
ncbi:GDP-mannose 4,6-dehydratase [Limnoglobus roseus]|uniref:NAD-dependent dehydratase n=1 Tax=Limnoglobus roseus TaxID=2598579 RepID=A0A5C1ADG9_9BACT|nr:GDP-mannose 4,6-dehydratase [Limnoglobus roseus]QEL16207.1 NAD-dependent dehydratase [Limnoglobus roseus]